MPAFPPAFPTSVWHTGVRIMLAVLVLTACVPAGAQTATSPKATADAVKAAYLYKFPGFITWPDDAFPDAASPVVIGVLGAGLIHAEVARLQAQFPPQQGRPIVVRPITTVDAAETIHILFVGGTVAGGAAQAAARVAGRPVLTVAESPHGLEPGVVLNFLLVDGRVRFDASLPAAEQARLKLSSRLLSVAEHVVGGQTP